VVSFLFFKTKEKSRIFFIETRAALQQQRIRLRIAQGHYFGGVLFIFKIKEKSRIFFIETHAAFKQKAPFPQKEWSFRFHYYIAAAAGNPRRGFPNRA